LLLFFAELEISVGAQIVVWRTVTRFGDLSHCSPIKVFAEQWAKKSCPAKSLRAHHKKKLGNEALRCFLPTINKTKESEANEG